MTPDHSNGAWTAGQIKELLRTLIDERDAKYTERFESQQREIRAALAALDHRLDGVNEFRKTLSDQQAGYATRLEVEGKIAALAERLAGVSRILDRLEGQKAGVQASWVFFLAAIGLIGTLLAMAVRFTP